MRPARLGLLVATAALTACGPPRVPLEGAIPEDARWVSALMLDGGGEVVSASGLLAFDGGSVETRVPGEVTEEVWVFGWTEEQIAPLRTPTTDPEIPVVPRSGLEPALPLPVYGGRSRPAGERLAPLDPVPDLTTAWLPRCPTVVEESQEMVVDLRCGSLACSGRFGQRGCAIELGLGVCTFPDMTVRVGGDGELSLAGEPGCQPASVLFPAAGAAVCDGCAIDLYVRDRTSPPPLPRAEAVVADAADPAGWSRPPYDAPLRALAGYGDRVYAAVAPACRTQPAGGTIHAFERADTLRIDRAGAPARLPDACGPTRLAAGEAGVFSAGTSTSGVWIARLDRDGRPVQRWFRTMPVPVQVLGLELLDQADRLAVVATDEDAEASRLWILRARDLALVSEHALPLRPSGGLAELDGAVILVALGGRVDIFAPGDGAVQGNVVLGTGEGVSNTFHLLIPLGGARFAGVAASGRSGIHVARVGMVENVGYPFQRAMRLTGLLPTPGEVVPTHPAVAAGFGSEPGQPAVLVRVAPTEVRFWPVDHVVGTGPLIDLHLDDRGFVWGALPAEGKVIRIPLDAIR